MLDCDAALAAPASLAEPHRVVSVFRRAAAPHPRARAVAAAARDRSVQPRLRQCRRPSRSAKRCSPRAALSRTGTIACATCHQPERAFTDGLAARARRRARRSQHAEPSTSPGSAGTGGTAPHDNLWAQSLRPMLDRARNGQRRRARCSARPRKTIACARRYRRGVRRASPRRDDEAVAVDAPRRSRRTRKRS